MLIDGYHTMSYKDIKDLRKSGKLEEAHKMAITDLSSTPDDIWLKRALSWVLYDYLKKYAASNQYDQFIDKLKELTLLHLPEDEKMLFDNVAWQVIKVLFSLSKQQEINYNVVLTIFNEIKQYSFTRPSGIYSVLFKALHKAMKENNHYTEMADWWDFDNFRLEDYRKEKLPNGKEVMALAEQGYISYARHLLPKPGMDPDKEAIKIFIEKLSVLMDQYPDYQYPAYFKAKLLLALGDKEEMLSTFLPFAKKKRNDFWVWELLGQTFSNDEDKMLACLCKALSCRSPKEMLVGVRQELARLLIKKELYGEAKKEIETIIRVRNEKDWKIPPEITLWEQQEWYKNTQANQSNSTFYKKYSGQAEDLLFSDVSEETVIVDFVNTNKKILNFIASEEKFGFFKFDRFLNKVQIGDILRVRFSHGTIGGLYQVLTVAKEEDAAFRNKYVTAVKGKVRIPNGKSFGFLNDVFIPPSIITKEKLSEGDDFKCNAIKSYNPKNKQWGWKIF